MYKRTRYFKVQTTNRTHFSDVRASKIIRTIYLATRSIFMTPVRVIFRLNTSDQVASCRLCWKTIVTRRKKASVKRIKFHIAELK